MAHRDDSGRFTKGNPGGPGRPRGWKPDRFKIAIKQIDADIARLEAVIDADNARLAEIMDDWPDLSLDLPELTLDIQAFDLKLPDFEFPDVGGL